MELSVNTLVSLLLQLMKATVLTESSFIISPKFVCYADFYRHESGGCRTIPFFLIYYTSTADESHSVGWKPLYLFTNLYTMPMSRDVSNVGVVGLGGIGVTCSPRDPRFAGSNPAEVDGFFQDRNILSKSPLTGTLSWGSRVWNFRLVKEPQTWKNRPLSKI